MNLAPIALFVYNRPNHTKATIESLSQNRYADQSELFVFCDGPKSEGHLEKVNQVKAIVKSIKGFKKVTVIEKEFNVGLANSIIAGVTDLIEKFGRVIVLEDDMVTSKYFLMYLNEGLEKYEREESVISIHAYRLPLKGKTPETYFLRGADCWGWATWKRGWDLFEHDGKKLMTALVSQNLTKEFDFGGSYPYTQMLKDQIEGRNDSWAIRWNASAFLLNLLTLYPGRSLVQNIGLDASGIHCATTDEYDVVLSETPIEIETIAFKENSKVKNLYKDYFRNLNKQNYSKRIFGKLTRILLRILPFVRKLKR
ncbi:glycosyltransferase [Leptospira stimsonii]|uniref:Glycosyl transferase n=1 Tax=Leptospira stimsonii TaxID=2202203 RepID=A0A396Z645_9LEPT|nr:glycosyltransferase [Leptospira stimsonii]RHX90972.1 glycosyl transferase [Leptospira stimsonii]